MRRGLPRLLQDLRPLDALLGRQQLVPGHQGQGPQRAHRPRRMPVRSQVGCSVCHTYWLDFKKLFLGILSEFAIGMLKQVYPGLYELARGSFGSRNLGPYM